MITKEIFELIETLYGCGYWEICGDHACPCHSDAPVSKGFNEKVYKNMEKAYFEENELIEKEIVKFNKELDMYEDDIDDYDDIENNLSLSYWFDLANTKREWS